MTHKHEMYSVGNIVKNYILSPYSDINRLTVIILKCIEISNHYVVYQELT